MSDRAKAMDSSEKLLADVKAEGDRLYGPAAPDNVLREAYERGAMFMMVNLILSMLQDRAERAAERRLTQALNDIPSPFRDASGRTIP